MFNKADSDLYEDLNIKKPKPINIIRTLFRREIGYTNIDRTETVFNETKRIYLAIYPNFTVINVKTPNCFLRRFSPDGRFLIAFNQLLNGIIIYKFNGSSSAQNEIDSLFKTYPKHLDKSDLNNGECEQLRLRIFNLFFTEMKNLKLIQQNELINRECTIFFNEHYVIVASSEFLNDDSLPPYSQLAENNETLHVSPIENYSIYLINLKTCKLCDSLKFKNDKIILTHNQGLYLYKTTFSVFSQQNQTIYIYKIIDSLNDSTNVYDKKFILMNKIGRFCYQYDSELLQNLFNAQFKFENSKGLKRASNIGTSSTIGASSPVFNEPKAYTEACYTSLKQRLITFFYKEAIKSNSVDQFYMSVNAIANLKLYRIQLLDENHILIKFTTTDYISHQKATTMVVSQSSTPVQTSAAIAAGIVRSDNYHVSVNQSLASGNIRNSTPSTNAANATNSSTSNAHASTGCHTQTEQCTPFFFVLYNIKNAEIVNIFRNNSAQLLHAYESFQDYFTLTTLDTNFTFHSLPSNDMYARQQLEQNIKNIKKFNNHNDVVKYLLTQIPISAQSYSVTPYLDHSLFTYDDKYISSFDRPKAIGDQVIRFNNRETNRPCFKIYPGQQQNSTLAAHSTFNFNNTNNNNYFANNNSNTGNNQPSVNNLGSFITATIHQQQQAFSNVKRLVAFIWHPREPFCISVQRGQNEYTVNFHIIKK